MKIREIKTEYKIIEGIDIKVIKINVINGDNSFWFCAEINDDIEINELIYILNHLNEN